MSPMPHKNAFEPKDARVTSMYDEDEDEDELDFLTLASASDDTPRPRRKKTGTQALAEFLISTSPEEFQKSPPKRSANPFFRRRNKNKSSSSSTSTSTPTPTTYRAFAPNTPIAKHVEIATTDTTSLARIASRTPSMGSTPPSVFRRSLMSNNDPQSPILPSNRSNKNRESSLYSDSIRYSLSTRSQTSTATANNSNNYHYVSVRSQHSILKRQDTDVSLAAAGAGTRRLQDREEEEPQEREIKATETLVNHYASFHPENFDTIERALAQRLERFQRYNMDTPSDTVAAGLATEHIRALEVSNQEQQQQQLLQPGSSSPTMVVEASKERKVRHMQVQTMPADIKPQDDQEKQPSSAGNPLMQERKVTVGLDTDQAYLIDQLQLQLAEETQQCKRLQAALDETCDHFEVLSGLAYKRLRELWEEKMHWENTCIELREKMLDTNRRGDTDTITEFTESV